MSMFGTAPRSTQQEAAVLTALNNLAIGGTGTAIQKTGATSFVNVSIGGGGGVTGITVGTTTITGGTTTNVLYNNAGIVGEYATTGTGSVVMNVSPTFSGNVGIGAASLGAKLYILSTTEQLRLGYDVSNYASFTVSSAGLLTINPTTSMMLNINSTYDTIGTGSLKNANTGIALNAYHGVQIKRNTSTYVEPLLDIISNDSMTTGVDLVTIRNSGNTWLALGSNGQLKMNNGSGSAPAYGFAGRTDSGMWDAGNGVIVFNGQGTNVFQIASNLMQINQPIYNQSASAVSTPAVFHIGAWYSGGSTTTTKPHVLIEQATATSTGWNTAGTGFGVNSISSFTGNLLDLQLNGSSAFNVPYTGNIGKYKSVATTGWGVPAIYGTGRTVGAVAAVASVATYTVGAADGSFLVSANVLVTTATVHSFTATVTYTDEGNTSRTITMQFSTVAGAFVTAMTNAQGTVPYEGVPLHIRCKASTSITIATTGTFTTVAYNVEGIISQIA